MNTNKPVSVNRSSLIPILAAVALMVAQNALAAAHFVVPPPLIPGNGGFAGVSGAQRARDSARPALRGPARPIIENYVKIQNALAQDSIQGVAENAAAIANAVRSDASKTFPPRLAQQAERLAAAKDLATARDAFHRVSPHLITYVKKNHLAGFYMGYCRMQKVAWLQADPAIANPYMGKAMPRCAWFRKLNGATNS